MSGLSYRRVENRGERVPGKLDRQVLVELVDVRHSAAHNEYVRVQYIDHDRQTARDAIDVSTPEEGREVIAFPLQFDDRLCKQFGPRVSFVFRFERPA